MENEFNGFSRDQLPFSGVRTFFVSAEGAKTEIQYFKIVNQLLKDELDVHDVKIVPFKSKYGNDPINVLRAMQERLKLTGLEPNDEAWVVIDKDKWTDAQLDAVENWASTCKKHGMALSNPFFEYWLLLHFESGAGVGTKGQCIKRLNDFLPNYKKGLEYAVFDKVSLIMAVSRAKGETDKSIGDCRKKFGSTNVYKLIEKMLPTGYLDFQEA